MWEIFRLRKRPYIQIRTFTFLKSIICRGKLMQLQQSWSQGLRKKNQKSKTINLNKWYQKTVVFLIRNALRMYKSRGKRMIWKVNWSVLAKKRMFYYHTPIISIDNTRILRQQYQTWNMIRLNYIFTLMI